MAKPYLILDEYMRFLDRDGRDPSHSILEVGVHNALSSVFWDEEAFKERGGVYDWKRDDRSGAIPKKELEW
jgi:radical S-adenosyl methionine domain-containing protein 2